MEESNEKSLIKKKKISNFYYKYSSKNIPISTFYFGILLREYDRIFKKKKIKKRTEGLWY